MRQLRPNRRGVIQPQPTTIHHPGQVIPYKKKNNTLPKIDRLLKGEKPRICITRKQGGIGDVLMTTPTIKAVVSKYGELIDYGTDFGYLDGALAKVLMHNPYINQVLPWKNVNKEDYDAILDLTCPCIAHEKPKAEPINRIDLFAHHLGLQLTDTTLDYTVTKGETQWAKQYIKENNLSNKKLILVQPFASASTRSTPLNLFKKSFMHLLQCSPNIVPIIITHGKEKEELDLNFGNVHIFHNYDVRHIAAIMTQCELVVCPDSAILHLAAALHHKTFTLFGPTDPYARVNYHPEAVAYWPAKELPNYPIWYESSIDGYLCWKRMEESVIVNSIIAMLNNEPLPNSRHFVTFGTYKIEQGYYEVI